MELEFECRCGGIVSDFTRGEGEEISTVVGCEDCETMYAVTITPLSTAATGNAK